MEQLDTLVTITRAGMGSGDPDLQQQLLGTWLRITLENGTLPGAIACYTDGVRMACEGSPVLDELRALEARGVHVILCKTCLDRFDLNHALARIDRELPHASVPVLALSGQQPLLPLLPYRLKWSIPFGFAGLDGLPRAACAAMLSPTGAPVHKRAATALREKHSVEVPPKGDVGLVCLREVPLSW